MKPYLYASLILYSLGFVLTLSGHLLGRSRLGRASVVALCAGLAAHSAGLAVRMYSTGHAPMASMHETLVFFSWTVVLLTLVVIWRYSERAAELVTVPVAVAALVFGLVNEVPGGPLALVLRTRWFEIHVIASFAAYAFFTLAFAAAVLHLVKGSREGGADRDARGATRFLDIALRAVLWGFFLFSVSMFSGAVWAYLAWGTYWLWEPKVLWSFIVWFYYAATMHAWYVREIKGRTLAIATLGGFAVMLFTWLGVGLLMKSSHSF